MKGRSPLRRSPRRRARNLLIRHRTMLVNALRADLAEFGLIAPKGSPMSNGRSPQSTASKPPLPSWRRSILRLVAAVNDMQPKSGNSRRIGQMASEPSDPLADKLRRMANR